MAHRHAGSNMATSGHGPRLSGRCWACVCRLSMCVSHTSRSPLHRATVKIRTPFCPGKQAVLFDPSLKCTEKAVEQQGLRGCGEQQGSGGVGSGQGWGCGERAGLRVFGEWAALRGCGEWAGIRVCGERAELWPRGSVCSLVKVHVEAKLTCHGQSQSVLDTRALTMQAPNPQCVKDPRAPTSPDHRQSQSCV